MCQTEFELQKREIIQIKPKLLQPLMLQLLPRLVTYIKLALRIACLLRSDSHQRLLMVSRLYKFSLANFSIGIGRW